MVGRAFNYNSYYSMMVCANCGHLARCLGNREGARPGGWWFAKSKAGSGDHPPIPPGGGKTGGVFLAGVGHISQPFKTTSSEQGGVQEKQGGMIFEQVCKK